MIFIKKLKNTIQTKKQKVMIVFDHMIADRGRKLNDSLVFVTQSCLAVPKNIRLNSIHYFVMKIPNTR